MEAKDKFILIPESDWENIYKVQDKIIDELKDQLSRKDVRIFMHRYTDHYFKPYFQQIGNIRVSIEGGYSLKDFNKQTFLNIVQESTGAMIIESKIAYERERINKENVEKIKKIPKFIRWLFNINYE